MESYYKNSLKSIYDICIYLNKTDDRKHALENVLHSMQDTLEMKSGMILLADNFSHDLLLEASVGLNVKDNSMVRYSASEGVVGKVYRHGVPIHIHDISKEPMFVNKLGRMDGERTSFIAVPINHDGKTSGVLAVDKVLSKMFSITTDVDILKMIATLIASFLHRFDHFERELDAVKQENLKLKGEVSQKYQFKDLIGKSKLMQNVFAKINTVSRSDSAVLIRGESGTGKEVVAKTIHYNSERAKKPFIAVNCAAIPGELIESELFGYTKGAFTGAVGDKKGKFEQAEGGTIFLDEIGDMPMEAQSKLLRVLQDKTVEKLGGVKPVKVDVRILAATNKNLEAAVKDGSFRLDLYYRLNVFIIFLPPLRKRKDDIPQLADYILAKLSKRYKQELSITQEALSKFMTCRWPGNIREFENCLERSAFESEDGVIRKEHIACTRGELCLSHALESDDIEETTAIASEIVDNDELTDREKVLRALEETGWVQAKAARLLGMTVRQINYRIKKYNISVRKI
jgi:Nif-specific regulatory protein